MPVAGQSHHQPLYQFAIVTVNTHTHTHTLSTAALGSRFNLFLSFPTSYTKTHETAAITALMVFIFATQVRVLFSFLFPTLCSGSNSRLESINFLILVYRVFAELIRANLRLPVILFSRLFVTLAGSSELLWAWPPKRTLSNVQNFLSSRFAFRMRTNRSILSFCRSLAPSSLLMPATPSQMA